MTKLLVPSLLALSLFTGCKKKAPSCDDVVDHTLSLMPPEMQGQVKAGRDAAIAKCEKMPPEARACALDAKSLADLMKCSQAAPSSKATEVDMPKPAASGPFGAWDMTARSAAWQGAWSGDGGGVGDKAAWQVSGDKITYVDRNGEKHLELELQSPCSAAFVEKSADGSSSSTIAAYTLKDGQLITGLGDAGQRKGSDAVVCGGGKVFTVDAKGCTEWEDNFGRFESKPGDCGFVKDGGKEVFRYMANGMETKDIVDGDVIWSEQLSRTHATKQPDLAAARKAQGL